MTNHAFQPARHVAESLAAGPAISADTVLRKFLVRWKVFAFCALAVPAVAVTLSHFVPPTYLSSAQILIRHQGGPDSLYSDIALNQTSMSGASIAEIVRSAPIGAHMIEAVGVQDEDIARSAAKVLFGKVAALIMPLFGRDAPDPSAAGDSRIKHLNLARELKPSIEAATLMMERSGGNVRDELIEVKLKSTNREKVAAMVNGLCEAYITEHKRRAREEILRASQTLGEQAAVVEAELERLQQSNSTGATAPAAEFAERVDTKPFASSLARTLSELELRVLQLKQTYTENAPAVVQAQAELDRTRSMLANQEATDAARETLNSIRKRQRQLVVAARIAESDQSNISIVERGLTPRKTKMTQVIRYGVPLVGGLGAGAFLGLIGVGLINLLDPKLYVAADLPTACGIPLVGVVPRDGTGPVAPSALTGLPHADARPALLQALSRLDVLAPETKSLLLVTSAENEAPSASLALQLSALLARSAAGPVLVVDANLEAPAFEPSPGDAGLRAVLSGRASPEAAIRPTALARLAYLGPGSAGTETADGGGSRASWSELLAYCRRHYTVTVVHAGGLLNSRAPAALAQSADLTLLVTRSGGSRKDTLGEARALLQSVGARILGAIHCGVRR